jgi:opacity protein-like surface antigen
MALPSLVIDPAEDIRSWAQDGGLSRATQRLVGIAALVLLAISIGAAPAWAQPERWTLRAGILGTDYEKRLSTSYFSNTTEIVLDGGTGLEIAAEYRPNRTIGWELSLGRLAVDTSLRELTTRVVSFDPFVVRQEVTFSSEGDFRIEPIAVALLIHPLRARRFDLYLGPQVAWVRYNVDVDGAPDRDAELGFGGKLGAEMRLAESSPWSVALELRHLQIPHEQSDRDIYADIGIQSAALAVGYHVGAR